MLKSNTLLLNARPLVSFDANNKDHRRYYRDFLEANSWGTCPVRFIVEDQKGDLISFINDQMLEYYMRREFSDMVHGPSSAGVSQDFRGKELQSDEAAYDTAN
jgi:hypothetical protein